MLNGYIDKEGARRIITSPRTKEQMLSVLERMPSADVAPVRHGRWEVDKSGYPTIVCSECGVKIPIVAGWCMDAHINYCPNCGATMDGGESDDSD